MPYVTGIERRAEARGILKGRAEMLRLTLEARFGDIPADVLATISALGDADRFAELQRQAVLLPSLDAFCRELDPAAKKTRKRVTRSPRK